MKQRNGLFINALVILSFSCGVSYSQRQLDIKEFIYPKSRLAPYDFAMLGSDVVLVPKDGGVYLAGTDMWYLVPKDTRKIVSVAPDIQAECIYYLKLSKEADEVYTTLVRLQKTDDDHQSEVELIKQKSNSLFQLDIVGKNKIYLLERGKVSRVWFCENNEKKMIYEGEKSISAFCAVDAKSFLMTQEGAVIYFAQGKSPEVLFRMNEKSTIDGLCVNKKGDVYFSTHTGIWKVSGRLDKKLVREKIIPTLHGQLKFIHPYLFVHIPKATTVVRLKIE